MPVASQVRSRDSSNLDQNRLKKTDQNKCCVTLSTVFILIWASLASKTVGSISLSRI